MPPGRRTRVPGGPGGARSQRGRQGAARGSHGCPPAPPGAGPGGEAQRGGSKWQRAGAPPWASCRGAAGPPRAASLEQRGGVRAHSPPPLTPQPTLSPPLTIDAQGCHLLELQGRVGITGTPRAPPRCPRFGDPPTLSPPRYLADIFLPTAAIVILVPPVCKGKRGAGRCTGNWGDIGGH